MAPGAATSELESFAQARGVENFLISFVDLLGVSRAKLVPKSAIREMEIKGAGFAGYAAHFDMSPADPDLFAVPDPRSVIQLPWKPAVAWVASDLYMNGKPVQQDPRRVLRTQVCQNSFLEKNSWLSQVEIAESKHLRMKTGVECEFFILSGSSDVHQLSDRLDKAEKPGYEQIALMRRYDLISEVLHYLEVLGWKPYQADHEDANGQFEINWEYDDCIATADKHVFFKFMVKSLAEKYGLKATFMPKPFVNQTGNGTHCHVSVWDTSGEHNVFLDKQDKLGLSTTAYEFLGGVLQNTKSITAILNPTVNSYKRIDGSTTLSGSSWAPCSIAYTGNNRTHLIRIPDGGRFELRLADGAVNPYLFQAAILACGLHGLDHHVHPGPSADWNGHLPPPEGKAVQILPTSLAEALKEFSASATLRKALGEEFVTSYSKIQTERWRSFTQHLSKWEIDNTIDC
ncbi:uncharacterized protein LOC9636675 isoform X1 [Selaginella moellendorffii]|uniref:uncharacterized protein LOC9636675 isoform X1 n=1 Tax=Selaginella moellendorffii TaxID=88036 RepID=UPI000D1CB7C4|nr:uncharacterized protein LOC9636675 isoform X1 [Selaginella moellendorffii]|eukprot:XP_024519123.1 uncharacterized protein LOC9636675 isoform X1 [Selaginella moellendorffii]